VSFTRSSAERIAAAIRSVEQGGRDSSGINLGPRLSGGQPYKLRLATFTGSWAVGDTKVVTLFGSAETVNVKNWCNASTGESTTEDRYVVFGKVDGTNSVVEIQSGVTSTCNMVIGTLDLRTLPGYAADRIQLLGHEAVDGTACNALTWYSITTCSTAAQ